MEELLETCNRINRPKKEGGYYKKPNGLWEFREGKGRYVEIDGEMQWQLS